MASEEVVLKLIKTKCLPILLYGLEACPLSKTNLRSLDFSVTRFLMKLFNTSDKQIITECQLMFGFRLPSALILDRSNTFRLKYEACDNLLFRISQLPLWSPLLFNLYIKLLLQNPVLFEIKIT